MFAFLTLFAENRLFPVTLFGITGFYLAQFALSFAPIQQSTGAVGTSEQIQPTGGGRLFLVWFCCCQLILCRQATITNMGR
jgi:hypothetical protein